MIDYAKIAFILIELFFGVFLGALGISAFFSGDWIMGVIGLAATAVPLLLAADIAQK